MRPMPIRFLALALFIVAPSAALAADAVGVVGALTGTASAKSASGERALKVGEKIFLDEAITTGKGTKLQLMLNDKSTITLNPNSTMQVKEFAFDPASKTGNLQMNSLKGAFRFIGGALTKNQAATIKTPVSSIGIRGGVVDGVVQGPGGETPGATDAVFNYGDEMSMTNANGQTTTTTEVGGGLTMNTPTDTPTIMTPEQVQETQEQLSGSTPPSGDDSAGGEGDEGADGTQTAEGGEGDGGDDAAGGDEGGEGGDSAESFGAFGESGDEGGDGSAGIAGLAGDDAGGLGGDVSGSSDAAGGVEAPSDLTGDQSTEQLRFNAIVQLSGGNDDIFNNPDGFLDDLRDNIDNLIENGGSIDNSSEPNDEARLFRFGGIQVNKTGDTALNLIDSIAYLFLNLDSKNSVFEGEYEEFFPNFVSAESGHSFLAPPNNPGYYNLGALDVDGVDYTGFVYRAGGPGGSIFYQLNEVPPVGTVVGAETSLLIGRGIDQDEVGEVIQNTVDAAIADGTGSISFYKFLPELTNHSQEHGASITPMLGVTPRPDGVGLFDFGRADVNPTRSLDEDDGIHGNFGIAIDWDNSQFLSGFVDWEGKNPNGSTSDTIAFGVIGDPKDEDSDVFTGAAYNIYQNFSAGVLEVNKFRIGGDNASAFQNTAGLIDAVVLEVPAVYNPATGIVSPVFQAAFLTNTTETPNLGSAMIETSRSGQADITSTTSADESLTKYYGYTAGVGINNINSSTNAGASPLSTSLFHSRTLSDVFIQTDFDDVSMGADITVFDATNAIPAHANKVRFNFGEGTSSAIGHSVFLSDDLYAGTLARQRNFHYQVSPMPGYIPDENITATAADPLNANADYITGFIVNASAINNLVSNANPAVSDTCNSCDYVHWGVWSVQTDYGTNTAGAAPEIDVVRLVPYVAGEPTKVADFVAYAAANVSSNYGSGLGNGFVDYKGPIYGTLSDNIANQTHNYVGHFVATIDLANRELDSFTGTFGNITNTNLGLYHIIMSGGSVAFNTTSGFAELATPVPVTFTAEDRLPPAGNDFATMTGTINGALFGPNAENIGGNFAVQTTTLVPAGAVLSDMVTPNPLVGQPTEQAAGVFLGARPAPAP